MDKQLLKQCIEAITIAACDGKWNCVLNLTLADVVEQLEESQVETPEQAVRMFADWRELQIEYGNEVQS